MESKNRREKSATTNYPEYVDHEEEEKMEIFLALMAGTMRRQLHQLQEKENNKNKRKRTTTSAATAAGWIPVFQPEDFTTEVEFKKHVPIVYPNPSGDKHPVIIVTSESTSSGLNLELTL
ncbi:hypothetical protein OROMI_030271 [Orobanche minor]